MANQKRKNEKYPYLKKNLNSRVRQEYIDFDYVDQLSEEEKEYLNKFVGEHYAASFEKDGTDLTANDSEGYRAAYHENNARNRCLYGRIRNRVAATKLLNYDDIINLVEEQLARGISEDALEDAIINYLDNKFIDSSDDSSNGSNSTN